MFTSLLTASPAFELVVDKQCGGRSDANQGCTVLILPLQEYLGTWQHSSAHEFLGNRLSKAAIAEQHLWYLVCASILPGYMRLSCLT
jgi:hypothetical protein